MKNNDIQDKKDQEDSDNSSYRGIYFETEIDSMDVYRKWRDMAGKYGSRKKYETNQRLDDKERKKKKGPPDGYIFDR